MPMGIGPGLSVTRFESVGWFDSSAYADLAAIADFSNNQYALPALGPELVVNGDFASGSTGWTNSSTGTGSISFTGGQLTVNRVDASNKGVAIQSLSGTSVGSTYEVNATVVSGTAFFGLASGGGNYTAGPVKFYATAVLSNQSLTIECPNNGSSCVIDNVSVREVLLTRNAAALGPNLAASGYTMSVNGGTGTATESPTGQLNLTGDGTNQATGDKSFTTVVGRRYRVVCTVGTNACGVSVGNTQGNNGIVNGAPAAVGFNSFGFTATAATTWIRFFRTSASLSTVTGIAVQELPATGAYPKRSATFAEWFAFTAASDTARSYVDQSGTWRNSAYGVTNLVTWSNNQSNAVWTISGGSSVGSPVISLTGNMDAYPLTFSASSAAGLVQNLTGVTSSTVYTASVWVRCVSGTELVRIKVWDNTSDKFSSNFTVTTDWQRVSFTLTTGTTNPTSPNIEIRNASDGLARTVQVYQVQLEPGSAATAPLVTTAKAVFGGVNAPRLDFRNSKRQLRLEDARTNLCLYGFATSNSEWAYSSCSAVAGQPGPAGFGNDAVLITCTAVGAASYVTATNTTLVYYTSGTTYTFARFVKAGTQSLVQFTAPSAAFGASQYANFDLATGSVTASAGLVASGITAYQGGWFRIWIAVAATSTVGSHAGAVVFIAAPTDGRIPAVTLTTSLYVTGGQTEVGSFASDPIPTLATAVTRAIETARFSPLLEAVMQRAAASVVVRGKLDVAGTSASDTRVVVGGNFCRIITSRTDATARSADAAAVLDVTPASGAFTTGFGAAYGTDSAGQSLDLNAGTVGSNTSPLTSANVRTAMYLGRDIGAGTYGHGLYDFVGISPERLSNATLQALAVPA